MLKSPGLLPLDFLAEFTQHIPAKGSHLIRYSGWYSNKARGVRQNARAPPGFAGFLEYPETVPETVCVPIDTFLAEVPACSTGAVLPRERVAMLDAPFKRDFAA